MSEYKAKPFIKWVGGKSRLVPTLDRLLPAGFSTMEGVTYIEPFVGGGAMLFFMLQKYQNIEKAVINDSNTNLITTYQAIKHTPEKLILSLNKIKREYLGIGSEEGKKEFYLSIRKRYNMGNLSGLDCATYLIFLNKTCFNGLYRVNSQGKFNVPFGRYTNPSFFDEETIMADSAVLQNVEILNGDFEDTEKFASRNSFLYFDPPYRPLDATSSFNSYTKESFNDNEQIRLKLYFDRLAYQGCLLMLSNADCKGRNGKDTFFDDLYKGYDIQRVWTVRSVNSNPLKRGKLTEIVVRNY